MAHGLSLMQNTRDGLMIVVTRLNDSQFAVNPDLIERIYANPDTTLVMVDGSKYIVTETIDEIVSMTVAYRARIIATARDLPPLPHEGSAVLGLVPVDSDDVRPDGGRSN